MNSLENRIILVWKIDVLILIIKYFEVNINNKNCNEKNTSEVGAVLICLNLEYIPIPTITKHICCDNLDNVLNTFKKYFYQNRKWIDLFLLIFIVA